jgi:hypothetical protein
VSPEALDDDEETTSPRFPHSPRPPDIVLDHDQDLCPGYACSQKPREARTFPRKDGLAQHLDRVHHKKWDQAYDFWEHVLGEPTASRCGFCGATFIDWKERQKHVGDEFRKGNGISMKNWKGDLGFSEEWMGRVQGVEFFKVSKG